MGGERRWIGWLGGFAMCVICTAPFVLLAFAGHGMRLTLGGHGPGPAFVFAYGETLSGLPGVLSVVLLAPLVGFRRRIVLWWVLPPVGLYYACLIGARIAVLGAPRPQDVAAPLSAGGRRAEDLIREGLAR